MYARSKEGNIIPDDIRDIQPNRQPIDMNPTVIDEPISTARSQFRNSFGSVSRVMHDSIRTVDVSVSWISEFIPSRQTMHAWQLRVAHAAEANEAGEK